MKGEMGGGTCKTTGGSEEKVDEGGDGRRNVLNDRRERGEGR